MKIQYRDLVLTIIAIALTIIAVEGLIGPSKAQSLAITKVQICNSIGTDCAAIIRGSALRVDTQ
jgi:hypothetical protein